MFRETITFADGSTASGMLTEGQAATLLQRAVRLGLRVEATRQGGAVIVRDVPGPGLLPRQHVVTLAPVATAGLVTDAMRRDLDVIGGRASSSLLRGRIHAGFYTIPAAATRRLVGRGLVTVTGTTVAVSLAARLALLAQDHRTESRASRGYVHPSDIGLTSAGRCKGGGRSGLTYDRSSAASCSCRGWSTWAEDRDSARQAAHGHRQAVTATFVVALPRPA